MEKRSSAPARVAAATALVLAFVIALVAIGGALGGGSDGSSAGGAHRAKHAKRARTVRKVPASYEVQSGDTLISIAHRVGVPVGQIERLNPEVDPQILVAGEVLKLR